MVQMQMSNIIPIAPLITKKIQSPLRTLYTDLIIPFIIIKVCSFSTTIPYNICPPAHDNGNNNDVILFSQSQWTNSKPSPFSMGADDITPK